MDQTDITSDVDERRGDPARQDPEVQPEELTGRVLTVRSSTEHWIIESLRAGFSKEVLRASLDRQLLASASSYAAGVLTESSKPGGLDRERRRASSPTC